MRMEVFLEMDKLKRPVVVHGTEEAAQGAILKANGARKRLAEIEREYLGDTPGDMTFRAIPMDRYQYLAKDGNYYCSPEARDWKDTELKMNNDERLKPIREAAAGGTHYVKVPAFGLIRTNNNADS